MEKDNPRWGCVRVQGELLKLGYRVSATAIRKLLRRDRIGPAPLRSRQTWKAFLRAQAPAIVLTDFLSVDTVFLKRLYVLSYMELATRRECLDWLPISAVATAKMAATAMAVNGHLKVPTFGQVKVPTRHSLLLALTSS